MNSFALSPLHLALVFGVLLALGGIAVRGFRKGRGIKGLPVLVAMATMVLGLGFMLSEAAISRETTRLQAYLSGYAPFIARQAEALQLQTAVRQGKDAPALDALTRRSISAHPFMDGIFAVRRRPDGAVLISSGLTASNTAAKAWSQGQPVWEKRGNNYPGTVAPLEPVWDGKAVWFLLGNPVSPRGIAMAEPIRGADDKVVGAIVLHFNARLWTETVDGARSGVLAMTAIMVFLVLLGGVMVVELAESLALVRVGRAEMVLQAERIREQMDIIAEKNQQMAAQQDALAQANARLHALATMDGLTNVMNHRALMDTLSDALDTNHTFGSPCSVVLMDVDNFKQLNDQYGHPAGDEVLRIIGTVLRQSCPPGASVGRYGGEEFMMILPGASESAGVAVAEEIRRRIAMAKTNSRPVTASIGVSTVYSMSKSAQTLIDEADRAMYHSKRSGKNRVTHYGHGLLETA